MNNDKAIALLKNELIVRDDIQIDELHKMFPEIIQAHTKTIYQIAEGYKLNGLNHVVLLVDALDGNNKEIKSVAILQDYFCPHFVGPSEDFEEIADHVWMRIMDEQGNMWVNDLFKFNDVYTYLRPNIWDVPEMFTKLEYFSYSDRAGIKQLNKGYLVDLNMKMHTPIPIYWR